MRVIAKAYEGEPLDRVVAGTEGDTVFLVNPNVNRTADELAQAGVGFPRFCVYAYSGDLFLKLHNAWEREDCSELTNLWRVASPI